MACLSRALRKWGFCNLSLSTKRTRLIDGQRRIEAYKKLGKPDIPVYVINLADIISGEFHANANRKNFTTSERVAITSAIEKFVKDNTQLGRPSTDDGKKGAKLAPLFAGKIRDNVAAYFQIGHTTLDKEIKIVEATKADPESFGGILEKVDANKLSIDKGYQEVKLLQKKQEAIEMMKEHSTKIDYKDRDDLSMIAFNLYMGIV